MADNPKSPDICVLCKKPLVEGEMVFRERGGDLVKHQVCPPKSLASLADDLERQTIVVGLEMTQAEVRRTKEAMMAAATALRAPTIAADERCESCRKVLGRGWKYDSTGDVKLCPYCYAELRREGRMTQAQGLAAALSTPSPTIAADDAKLVARLRYSAESGSARAAGQDRTMLEAADRIEALGATPSPTIAAPSPSNALHDNPKSLASLADDLEALAKRIQTGLPNAAADLCFRAAAALRAPTIAPQIFTECKGIEELIAPLFDVRAELVRRLGRIGEILFESGFQAESPIESPLGKKR